MNFFFFHLLFAFLIFFLMELQRIFLDWGAVGWAGSNKKATVVRFNLLEYIEYNRQFFNVEIQS